MSVRSVADRVVHERWGSWGRLRRAVGYAAVGATGVPVDLGVLAVLLSIGVHHVTAVSAGFGVAMLWNFTLQRRYVYGPGGSWWRELARYAAVDISAYVVRVGVVILTVDVLHPWSLLPGVPGLVAPPVAASAAAMAISVVIGSQGVEELVWGEKYVDN